MESVMIVTLFLATAWRGVILPSYSKKVLSVEDKLEILKLIDSRASYNTITIIFTYPDVFTYPDT